MPFSLRPALLLAMLAIGGCASFHSNDVLTVHEFLQRHSPGGDELVVVRGTIAKVLDDDSFELGSGSETIPVLHAGIPLPPGVTADGHRAVVVIGAAMLLRVDAERPQSVAPGIYAMSIRADTAPVEPQAGVRTVLPATSTAA